MPLVPAKVPIIIALAMSTFWGVGLVVVPKWMINTAYSWETSDLTSESHAAVVVTFQNFGSTLTFQMILLSIVLRLGTETLLANVNFVSGITWILWCIRHIVSLHMGEMEYIKVPVSGTWANLAISAFITLMFFLATDWKQLRFRVSAVTPTGAEKTTSASSGPVKWQSNLYWALYYYSVTNLIFALPLIFGTSSMMSAYGMGKESFSNNIRGYDIICLVVGWMGLMGLCQSLVLLATVVSNDVMFSYATNRFLTYFTIAMVFQQAFQMILMQDLGFVDNGNAMQWSLLLMIPVVVLGSRPIFKLDNELTPLVEEYVQEGDRKEREPLL